MPPPCSPALSGPFRNASSRDADAVSLAISCDRGSSKVYCICAWTPATRRSLEHHVGPALKKVLVAPDQETLALAMALAWLLAVQLLVLLAWEAELLTRQAALLHWLVVGVLPPALALWSLPNTR